MSKAAMLYKRDVKHLFSAMAIRHVSRVSIMTAVTLVAYETTP